MVNPRRFYTYAYLREDRTPYYIGKGQGRRIYRKGKGEVSPPKDKSRIIFLKQNLTEEEALTHEKYMIAVFGRKDLGTGILHNKTDGGDGISGFRHSEETKIKWSKSRKGENNPFYKKTHSEEVKIIIGQTNKGNKNWLNKNHSEETKKKISDAKKGRYCGKNNPHYGKKHSQEAKDKISRKNKGRKWTEEQKKNFSKFIEENGSNFYGKKHSQEAKDKISRKNKGKKISEDTKEKLSSRYNKLIKIISPDGVLIEEITTIRMFCKKYNLPRWNISNVLRGKKDTHNGWRLP